MNRKARQAQEAGFSLTEMLIALFVLSLLAVAGSSVLGRTYALQKRFQQDAAASGALERSYAMLRDDLEAMSRTLVRPADLGLPEHVLAGESGRTDGIVLSLARRSVVPDEADGLRRRGNLVVYRRAGNALVREVWFSTTPRDREPDLSRTVFADIESLEFAFGDRGRWLERWFEADPRGRLPEAIRLRVKVKGRAGYEFLFLPGTSP